MEEGRETIIVGAGYSNSRLKGRLRTSTILCASAIFFKFIFREMTQDQELVEEFLLLSANTVWILRIFFQICTATAAAALLYWMGVLLISYKSKIDMQRKMKMAFILAENLLCAGFLIGIKL